MASPRRSSSPPGGRARTIAFEVTSRCDSSCLYCYNVWKSAPSLSPSPRELSLLEIRTIFSTLIRQGRYRRIDLTGGEPLLREDVFDLIDLLRELGGHVSLVTGARLISSSVAKDIARREIGPVQPTLLSTDRSVHDALKGGESFDDTVRSIALLLREKVKVSVSFICTRQNYGDFAEVVKLCHAMGVKHVGFGRLCTAGEAVRHLDDIGPEPWMVWECMQQIPSLHARFRVAIGNLITVPHCVGGRTDLPGITGEANLTGIAALAGNCSVASGKPNFTISPAGDVRPCSVSPVVLGNVLEQSWRRIEARYRQKVLPLFQEALPEICRQCERLDSCRGGCRESARGATGALDGADPLCGN